MGPVFVLSLFKVKEAAYVSQAYPALALLMACGLLTFLEVRPACSSGGQRDRIDCARRLFSRGGRR